MNKIGKLLFASIIIMPISILIIRGVPELVFGLNIHTQENNIIMFILIIKISLITNKWIYN